MLKIITFFLLLNFIFPVCGMSEYTDALEQSLFNKFTNTLSSMLSNNEPNTREQEPYYEIKTKDNTKIIIPEHIVLLSQFLTELGKNCSNFENGKQYTFDCNFVTNDTLEGVFRIINLLSVHKDNEK